MVFIVGDGPVLGYPLFFTFKIKGCVLMDETNEERKYCVYYDSGAGAERKTGIKRQTILAC